MKKKIFLMILVLGLFLSFSSAQCWQMKRKQQELKNAKQELQYLKQQIKQIEKWMRNHSKYCSSCGNTVPTQPVQTQCNPIAKMMAKEVAINNARRELAKSITGAWIAACSKNIQGMGSLKIAEVVPSTKLIGARTLPDKASDYNKRNGWVYATVQMTQAQVINSINSIRRLSQDEYMELRFMVPKVMTAVGVGGCTALAKKELTAAYGAQMDAQRKLVEQLKGVMIKSSSRMENFVVTKDEIMSSIEATLLLGIKVVESKIVGGNIAQTTIEISRNNFIYSMRKELQSKGLELSPDEYLNLRNMLTQEKYQFTGNAAVK